MPSGELPEDTGTTPKPVEKVPMKFASAELSLESFMAAMALAGPLRPDQYLQANEHLDLSNVSRVVREERGIKLSQQLNSILQTADLDLEQLKVTEGQTLVTLYRQPSGNEIQLEPGADGYWRFNSQTVDAIPDMHETLTDKGKIESWRLKILDFDIFGLNANLWLALFILPLLGLALGSFVVMLLRIPLTSFLSKKVHLDDKEQKRLFKPLGWIAASMLLWLSLSILDFPPALLLALTVGVKFMATLAIITAIFRMSDALSSYLSTITSTTSTKIDDMLIPLVRRSLKTIVAIVGMLCFAQNLDIEVWSLFAGFSIFGAMVALAGQDTVKNFFGSLTVLLDQPFAVGDWIVVGSIEGVVEEVGFRSTRIRTFHDSLITLPNSQLITASVDNYGVRNFRRYSKKISVRWNTPPEKLEAFCEGVRELVRQHPLTRKDSYQVWVNDMNEYSLQIMLYIFWAAPDWDTELRERHRFLLDLHRLATELKIELAYPSQKILLSRGEECFEENFDVEQQELARKEGRDLTAKLLGRSLPSE